MSSERLRLLSPTIRAAASGEVDSRAGKAIDEHAHCR
jgi:hypothetical protein